MSKKERMMQIWISFDSYRKLLTVRGALQRWVGKRRTLDEVIKELIDFWKEQFKPVKSAQHTWVLLLKLVAYYTLESESSSMLKRERNAEN